MSGSAGAAAVAQAGRGRLGPTLGGSFTGIAGETKVFSTSLAAQRVAAPIIDEVGLKKGWLYVWLCVC